MTDCAACLERHTGDFDRATRYDAARGWRFIIAMINDDPDAAEKIVQQMGDCPGCLRAFGWHLGGVASGMMLGPAGRENAENAAAVAGVYLDQVLNSAGPAESTGVAPIGWTPRDPTDPRRLQTRARRLVAAIPPAQPRTSDQTLQAPTLAAPVHNPHPQAGSWARSSSRRRSTKPRVIRWPVSSACWKASSARRSWLRDMAMGSSVHRADVDASGHRARVSILVCDTRAG